MRSAAMWCSAVAVGAALAASGAQAQTGEVVLVPIPAVGTVAVGEIAPFPTTKSIAGFNTARALLDDRKKLKLTEPQITALTGLQATLTARNADVVTRYDSLLREYKATPPALRTGMVSGVILGRATTVSVPRAGSSGGAGTLPTGGPVVITETMRGLWDASQELMVRHNADVTDSVALLDEAQRDAAMKRLDEQTRDMLKALPQPPTRK